LIHPPQAIVNFFRNFVGLPMPVDLSPLVSGDKFFLMAPVFLLFVDGFQAFEEHFLGQIGNGYAIFAQRYSAAGLPQGGEIHVNTFTTIGSLDKRGDGVYYFTSAQFAQFSFPNAGEIGNSGRNSFRGPAYYNVDLSLIKKFRVTETSSFQFRAEAYNAFNHTQFSTVNVGAKCNYTTGVQTGTQFGQITAARDPRSCSSRCG
jgi:hypothetical protein